MGQENINVITMLDKGESLDLNLKDVETSLNATQNDGGKNSMTWKSFMTLFKAARRVWPNETMTTTSNRGESRKDSLLEKFSVPDDFYREEVQKNSVSRRFTFAQGIPIKGSDNEEFNSDMVHYFTVNPEGNVLFSWLFIVTLAWLYSVWSLIARQAFTELREGNRITWICLDYSCDLVYVLDIAIQLRTGYLENGLLVFNTKKLAQHYGFSQRFVFDLLSLCPFDLLYLITLKMEPLYRFTRFFKAYRAKQFYRKAESATSQPNVLRVLILCHTLMLIMHWFACFYYMISESEHFYTPPGDERGWAYPLPPGPNKTEWHSLQRKYLHSIYWACLTLTTIGEKQSPTTDLEYICTLAAYFLGIFVFATVVGQVGNVIANKNANRLEFERLVDNAKTFMKTKNVPKEMQKRVLRWYDYSWSRDCVSGTGDVKSISMMPKTLQVELAIHVNLNTLRKVSIFRLVQPEFLYALVLKMKSFIFTPGDLVVRQGEVAREMYIISHGILEVVRESGTVLARFEAGDFFGEIGILDITGGVNKRVANVRSVGYSEVFSLSADDVCQAMEYYPEAKKLLMLYARQRLQESHQTTDATSSKIIEESHNFESYKESSLEETVTPALSTRKDWRMETQLGIDGDQISNRELIEKKITELAEMWNSCSSLHHDDPNKKSRKDLEKVIQERDETIARLNSDIKLLMDKLQMAMSDKNSKPKATVRGRPTHSKSLPQISKQLLSKSSNSTLRKQISDVAKSKNNSKWNVLTKAIRNSKSVTLVHETPSQNDENQSSTPVYSKTYPCLRNHQTDSNLDDITKNSMETINENINDI